MVLKCSLNTFKRFSNLSFRLLLCFLLLCSCSKKKSEKIQDPAPGIPVKISTASLADVPYYISGIGRLVAYNTVNITPQVTGRIMKVAFNQGDLVKKGDLLFVLDSRLYEADLLKALGNLAIDQASLTLAQKKVERYSELLKQDYYSAVNFDELVQNVKIYEGSIQRDKGDIATARLNLEYSQIRAPIEGFVGIKNADEGNLAVADNADPLVILLQITPLYAEFTIAEKYLNEVQKYQKIKPLPVEVYFQSATEPSLHGELSVINNRIELGTGMIRLRATLPNQDYLGWPNTFITAKILVKVLKNSVVVPEEAIQIAQDKEFIYVVKADMTVESKSIKRGIRYGNQFVIETGIEAGQKIVTEGQLNLYPNATVVIKEASTEKVNGQK